MLHSLIVDGIVRQTPMCPCVALFTECILPLFLKTSSPELKQLFAIGARHIDMTATFLSQQEPITALPAEFQNPAFAALLHVVQIVPIGATNHKTACMTDIGQPSTAPSSS